MRGARVTWLLRSVYAITLLRFFYSIARRRVAAATLMLLPLDTCYAAGAVGYYVIADTLI